MALVSLQEVSLGFGGPLLLENVSLQIERGDWIGLLGRNGMGKTTLLRLVYGDLEPESGQIARAQNLRTADLPQEIPPGLNGTAAEVIAGGLAGEDQDDAEHAWQRQVRVDNVISRMQIDPAAPFETLSAGMKRRVLLGRGLVRDPELLILDEPTNHLDLASREAFEQALSNYRGASLVVSHDRRFIERFASLVVEL